MNTPRRREVVPEQVAPILERPQYMRVLMDHLDGGTATAAVNGGEPAGDCLRACVASVLGIDADDVPHFVQYVEHPEGTDSHLWYWSLIGFCDAYGWRVDYTPDEPKGWALADGKSPRGHQHVVVVYDGQLIHDPHPKGEGLASTTGWFTFERKEPSKRPPPLSAEERERRSTTNRWWDDA